MQIVLGSGPENGWHEDWMRQTPQSYEWWYTDVISDDGEWDLVVIFLLGNPFSSYYRLCVTGESADPIAHNGVFVALHRRGRLHHYAFVNYPLSMISDDAANGDLSLTFGPNRIATDNEGVLSISVNEDNANRRRLRLRIVVAPGEVDRVPETRIDPDAGHWWLPAISAGKANVSLTIQSTGTSLAPEVISFAGSGYHDHNWGTLPFDGSLSNWTWARAHFSDERAAIVYWTVNAPDGGQCRLLLFDGNGGVTVDENAELSVSKWQHHLCGIRSPQQLRVRSGGTVLELIAENQLETVPFYVRFKLTATMIVDGEASIGTGIGEYFKPGLMGSPLVASALERRIYRPVDGA